MRAYDVKALQVAAGTIVSYVLAQGGAGTSVIAAAVSGVRYKILGAVISLSAAGTIKFTDGAGDLTGPMDVAALGWGFVITMSALPMIETSVANSALSIVTTGGKANGIIRYIAEA